MCKDVLRTTGRKRPALVLLFLLSDCGPGDGGTLLVSASHRAVEEHLRATGVVSSDDMNRWCCSVVASVPSPHVKGDNSHEKRAAAADHRHHLKQHAVCGRAGDVVLMHPWCVHSACENVGDTVRILSNAHVHLVAPKDTIK